MCLIGAVGWFRGCLIFITQLIAAIASAGIVSCLFPGTLSVRTQLRNTSVVRGLFIEMFLTAMLVFTVFMLAAEKHKGTFLAPVGIGLAMFIAELSGQCDTALLKTIGGKQITQLTRTITHRRLLHRRQPEPCSLLRSGRHHAHV